jgi:latrophilin 1
MDIHAVKLDVQDQVALQIITYIGCIISVICLVLAIVTFQLFRGLKVLKILILNFYEFIL